MPERPYYLKSQEINREKWDNCISNSQNPLVYGYSWYLDLVAPGWSAIILGDYIAVLPLNIKSRFGIKYVMQPLFAQQLGIFTKVDLSYNDIIRIYKCIPALILTLHNFSGKQNIPKKFYKQKRDNYVLNLNSEYKELNKSYGSNCKRNIRQAIKECQSTGKFISTDEFLSFLLQNVKYPYIKSYPALLSKLLNQINGTQKGFLESVHDRNGILLASGFFIKTEHSITFIAGASSNEGYKKKSMFLLMDEVIRRFAGNDLKLDFEGSANRNIARFYKGFGSKNEPYFAYEHFLLRFFLKFM